MPIREVLFSLEWVMGIERLLYCLDSFLSGAGSGCQNTNSKKIGNPNIIIVTAVATNICILFPQIYIYQYKAKTENYKTAYHSSPFQPFWNVMSFNCSVKTFCKNKATC